MTDPLPPIRRKKPTPAQRDHMLSSLLDSLHDVAQREAHPAFDGYRIRPVPCRGKDYNGIPISFQIEYVIAADLSGDSQYVSLRN